MDHPGLPDSGLFTRDQVEAFFGYAKSSANRFIQALLRTRISHKPIASETVTDGRRICRIFGKQIYHELEIPPIRHRRETSLEVTRRRLLSLDFVLDHPELAWLGTEREKLACFEQLGIEPFMLPRRIYTGRAKGRIRYFPLGMPVAMGPEAALFAYIDPGVGAAPAGPRPAGALMLGRQKHERGRETSPQASPGCR